MELYQDEVPELKDSKGTQSFCNRIKKLIQAMNCRTPVGGMKPDNEAWKVQ